MSFEFLLTLLWSGREIRNGKREHRSLQNSQVVYGKHFADGITLIIIYYYDIETVIHLYFIYQNLPYSV